MGIVGGSSNNTIGGTTHASANTIAFNQGIGVSVSDSGVGNRVLSNSIFLNSNLGIDLNRDGVTANDFGEGKTFLGKKVVTTDGRANASFAFKPARKVGVGKAITATATGPNNNTSELSAAKKVVEA